MYAYIYIIYIYYIGGKSQHFPSGVVSLRGIQGFDFFEVENPRCILGVWTRVLDPNGPRTQAQVGAYLNPP